MSVLNFSGGIAETAIYEELVYANNILYLKKYPIYSNITKIQAGSTEVFQTEEETHINWNLSTQLQRKQCKIIQCKTWFQGSKTHFSIWSSKHTEQCKIVFKTASPACWDGRHRISTWRSWQCKHLNETQIINPKWSESNFSGISSQTTNAQTQRGTLAKSSNPKP